MSEFTAQSLEEGLHERETLAHAPGSLSALYYIAAANFGAEAINHISHGTTSHNIKYFIGETIISGIAASRGISHLEEYLRDRKAARADTVPAAPIALPQNEVL